METVVVTGATGGIGGAVVGAFAQRGDLVVAGTRDRTNTHSDTDDRDGSGRVEWVGVDVRDEYDVERLMETAARTGDGIDVVIPCAAVNHTPEGHRLAETSYAAFDDTFRTNARGVFATIREAVPHLNEGARVLVPGCEGASAPENNTGAYGVSKAASTAIAMSFASELGAAVAVVDPGVVASELTGPDGREPAAVAELFVETAEAEPESIDGQRIDHRTTRP